MPRRRHDDALAHNTETAMTLSPLPFDLVRSHTMGAVRHGVPLDTLLSKSFINPRHGDNRDSVSLVQQLLLCMNTSLMLGDATHGMARAGVDISYPAIGLRMALGCSTLEGAVHALGRLYALASNAVHIQLSTEQDVATVSVRMEATDAHDVAYLEENFLSWTFLQMLHFLGGRLLISEVTVRDPLHFSLGCRHWAIGGRVSAGEVTAFHFARSLLSEPPSVRAGENVMWECHQTWLGFLGGRSWPASSTRYVGAAGFVRFSDMVRASGVSSNTLRRHLQTAHGGFRDTRRQSLVAAASDRLCASDESVETIAVELGYSDARSFRRFLKSATGLTPQQIRDRYDAEASQQDLHALLALEALSARMSG